jgi:hypothetical protein
LAMESDDDGRWGAASTLAVVIPTKRVNPNKRRQSAPGPAEQDELTSKSVVVVLHLFRRG